MSRTACRGPRKTYPMNCKLCGRVFTAFRKTAEFCSDDHRVRAHQEASPAGAVRRAVLERDGNKCVECGAEGKLVVRSSDPKSKTVANSRSLCGKHNSAESRKRFQENHPAAGPGYSRRVYTERRDKEIDAR